MRNKLKALLHHSGAAQKGWLSIPSGYSAELMAGVGWDSITVDLQHGVQDYLSMISCLKGIVATQITLVVRVPENSAGIIGKVLDAGAWGVIYPMINTPDEARSFVSNCLHPPQGSRSNGPNRAIAYSDSAPYQLFANVEVLVIPVIETAEAVDNLEATVDVPGVSGVYVGLSDLGFSLGLGPAFRPFRTENLGGLRADGHGDAQAWPAPRVCARWVFAS